MGPPPAEDERDTGGRSGPSDVEVADGSRLLVSFFFAVVRLAAFFSAFSAAAVVALAVVFLLVFLLVFFFAVFAFFAVFLVFFFAVFFFAVFLAVAVLPAVEVFFLAAVVLRSCVVLLDVFPAADARLAEELGDADFPALFELPAFFELGFFVVFPDSAEVDDVLRGRVANSHPHEQMTFAAPA